MLDVDLFSDALGELAETQKRALEERRQARKADLQAVMSTGAGRRFLWRLINEDSGLGKRSHAGELTHETAYLEGRRALAVDLNNELLEACPEEYLRMLEETLLAQRAGEGKAK